MTSENVQIKVARIWVPKPRRNQDTVIMDYVMRHLPQTMWKSINQCRIFLKAITFSNITSFNGAEIPQEIYQVKGKHRSSRIEFPNRIKPPKKAIERRQYFIRFFTKERKLNTPLGDWGKKPYQLYPHAIDEDHRLLYKRTREQWEVYYHKANTRIIYYGAGVSRSKLPKKWMLVNVIKCSKKILKVILPDRNELVQQKESLKVGNFSDLIMKTIEGNYIVDQVELTFIAEQWHTQSIKLLCGSEGGLKDRIGTNGYVIYGENRAKPLIQGYSVEQQEDDNSSSTRQELLAQLCIEY